MISWPLACAVGSRMKHYQGGVPAVPFNRYEHRFINVNTGRMSRLNFRTYSFGTALVAGYLFAYYTVDSRQRSLNHEYNRPDLKPFPAMVHGNEA